MLFRRITERVRDENWVALSLELRMVIVGILLAFQVDRLYGGWQDRQLEDGYLDRLTTDLQSDTAEIAEIVARTGRRLAQVQLLTEAIDDPRIAGEHPSDFVHAIEQVTWRSVPTITTSTYDELLSTGRMALLRSERLRNGLAEYYAFIVEQTRLGLGEDDQDRFRLETLGLLSGEHLSAIEDASSYDLDVSAEEAVEIAEGFASRRTAHPWLSRLMKYQVLMRRLALEFDARAGVLLTEIEEQLNGDR